MSTTPTQSDPSRNPARKRRRRRRSSSSSSEQSSSQSTPTQSSQRRGSKNRQNRRGSGNRNQSTRRNNASRGSGGVYRIARTGERARPALWRRILQALTFGLFKADPYFIPGSERFARPESAVAPPPKDRSASAGGRERKTRDKSSSDQPKESSRRKRREPSERTPEVIEVTSPRCFVGNLSYDVQEEELKQLFSEAGLAATVELVINSRSGKSKGYGFVTMGSVDEAKTAVSRFHDHELKGRKMVVSGAKSRGPKTAEDGTED